MGKIPIRMSFNHRKSLQLLQIYHIFHTFKDCVKRRCLMLYYFHTKRMLLYNMENCLGGYSGRGNKVFKDDTLLGGEKWDSIVWTCGYSLSF